MPDAIIPSRITWDSQVPIPDAAALMVVLRAAGLPLSNTVEVLEDESGASCIVCIAALRLDGVHALVACPSGLMYRFEPAAFEQHFWHFACRNYYLITGNLADRREMADLAGLTAKDIKGRALIRGQGDDASGLSLDGLLGKLGWSIQQPTLF